MYDESQDYPNNNNRIVTNETYHETRFGGYGIYYNHLTPSGNFLPDRNGNTYNLLDRDNQHNKYNHIDRTTSHQNVQDKIRKTMRKDEPNMELIRAINQEIHNTTINNSNTTDMDDNNINNTIHI